MGWFSKAQPGQEKPAVSFSIDWTPEVPRGDFESTNPALLVTDVENIDAGAVPDVLSACGAMGAAGQTPSPIVWITPGLSESAAHRVFKAGGFAVRAHALSGQPLRSLLEDVALFANGRFLAAELGFGLPRIALPAVFSGSGLVAPGIPWSDIRRADLGQLMRIKGTASQILMQTGRAAANVGYRVQQLQDQLPGAADNVERAGLEARLRRLGAQPAASQVPQAVADASPPKADVLLMSGLASDYFITNALAMTCELEHAWILAIESVVTEFTTLLPSLALAVKCQKPLVVLAPEIQGTALAGLVVNKLRGVLRCAAIGLGTAESPSAATQLRAIADRTGAWLVTPGDLTRLARPAERMFGQVARVEADRHRCRFTLCS